MTLTLEIQMQSTFKANTYFGEKAKLTWLIIQKAIYNDKLAHIAEGGGENKIILYHLFVLFVSYLFSHQEEFFINSDIQTQDSITKIN